MNTLVTWSGVLLTTLLASASAQTPGASRVTPNLVDNIARPLRYRPDGADFVIENGAEFFNRPLYGGNTAFRVDGGDRPEFVLYLPGRGGNLRLGLRPAAGAAKWLHDAAKIETRYRPGELRYEIRDPLLGAAGVLRLVAIAYAATEGLALRVEAEGIAPGLELVWAYGGVNGQRGTRDGDIGTERVPISEWFQLQPEFCRDNAIALSGDGRSFTLRAKPATIAGAMPAGATLAIADAEKWSDLGALLGSAGASLDDARASENGRGQAAPLPVVVGRVALENAQPLFLSLQRVANDASASPAPAEDLATYREVTAPSPGATTKAAAPKSQLPSAFTATEVPQRFAEAEQHFDGLRQRVTVETPNAFFNAAVGALNVAADAVWDDPQQDIMHGAIAWRTRLLGWRGPYSLDALGWHERARQHFIYWASRQNTAPIPGKIPPADEKANLARNEPGLHTNGDMSNSHYDMNLVFIDALFRHLMWTGDLEFAKKMWPVIERHLAWERRLFRREFGPEKLPLYEAYAAIWASDDLQYSGGGAMHASAYNYFHHQQAARLARLIGADPKPYQSETLLLEHGMRALLWVAGAAGGAASGPGVSGARPDLKNGAGWFAESKDWLGAQRVHPAAALWTFYHTMDSDVPTALEAWQMTRYVDAHIPHLPVRGPGVPEGYYTLASSNWLPYDWSINNVVMGEAVHTALGYWQAGRADEAWKIMQGSLLAAMYMGISPGNVGSMSYLDVYRRESQRDFGDGSGVLSRAIVEGVFGVKPDALAGELRVTPGWPADWAHARITHPDFGVSFQRAGDADTFAIEQRFAKPLALRLRLEARHDRVASVTINGAAARWHLIETAVGAPRIEILSPAAARHQVSVTWAGGAIVAGTGAAGRRQQGEMRWWQPAAPAAEIAGQQPMAASRAGRPEPVDLSGAFNDRVTQIFKNEYRAPRSPFVSLALPKQGLGGWAGGMNATAEIDDRGLRAVAARSGGRLVLPDGTPLVTPPERDAKNILFVSQWANYPHDAQVALAGRAHGVVLLLAGSTNPMQSRFENGEVVVTYADGTSTRLALENPTTWWPIEQDYFFDDFQFRLESAPEATAANAPPPRLPTRVDLKTGDVRLLEWPAFKGKGGRIPGGAASVLDLALDPQKELRSLTVRATANDVVIGLMAATLVR